MTEAVRHGLSLAPFRALRPNAVSTRLATLLCPPYDVIGEAERARLLAADPDNAVALILPEPDGDTDRYTVAARRLDRAVDEGLLAVDEQAALYVYEMGTADGSTTRGLVGAVELRDPADGVILPHENTMAGPVSDRLSLMTATQANLEPIYLVYDGGGFASQVVSEAASGSPVAETITSDDVTHRLWALTDEAVLREIARDLWPRRALIADGHHRYATYRELQRRYGEERGPGPWDRGLTLLVDATAYGPQVHAIHRVLIGVPVAAAIRAARDHLEVTQAPSIDDAMARIETIPGFAVVVTDGTQSFVLQDPSELLAGRAERAGEPNEVAALDVTVLHRVLVEQVWKLADTVEAVGYAHSIEEAVSTANASAGSAVLLRPTPVAAVAAVAAAGGRMPRKSTLFTPKPASGLVMRRFSDER